MEILVISGSPKVKAGSATTDSMPIPYRKVLEQAEKASPKQELIYPF